jgi:uncharacterized protein involved in outer membrane biogenesis
MKISVYQRIISSKLMIGALAILILYTLAGFWLAPYLVSRLVPDMIAEKMQRELRVGTVKINPFLFRFQADDVGLHELDGSLIAGFSRVFIDFELSSLFHWALVFKTIRLDQPRVNIVIDAGGSLNLAKQSPTVPPKKNAEPSDQQTTEDTAPPRIMLRHIQIVAGEIAFIDRRQSIPATVAIRPLNIELKDISTLPDREGPYSLTATTQDQESFHLTGDITLYPFKSSGRLGVSDVSLATVWQFFRDSLTMVEPGGRFSIDSNYTVNLGGPESSVRFSDLQFRLAELSVALPGYDPSLLELSNLEIQAPRVDVGQREIEIETIQFKDAVTSVVFDETGSLNWSRISTQSNTADSPPVQETSELQSSASQDKQQTPWHFQVADVALNDIQFQFRDLSRSPQLHADIVEFDGAFQVDLQFGAGDPELRVYNAWLAVNDIKLENPETPDPEICIQTWQLNGGEFDLDRRQLTVERVSARDGVVNLIRDAAGDLNLISLFVPKSDAPETRALADSNSKASALAYDIKIVDISNFNVAFSDLSVQPDGEIFQLNNLKLAAADIDGKNQLSVDLSFDLQTGGRVEVHSKIDPLEPSVQADIDVETLSLALFEVYLKPHAALRVASGVISTQGAFVYRKQDPHPRIAYTGGFDVGDLQILEPASDQTLLGWDHLLTSDLKLQLQPDLLAVSDLKLSGLDGQFIIFEDGSLNLTHAFRKGSDGSSEKDNAGSAKTDAEVFPVYIHKLRVDDGGLFFADYSLIPQFATRIHQLAGSIIGMSSQRGARAQVQLDGRVNDYGMSKIEGELNVFNPGTYTDMAVLFRNLEMTRLTPYSGKFVGRRIDFGKLTLDLKYKIENSKLRGENQIIVDRIELGERVDSPDAVPLPLSLAIAILEDANGVIDIGLPVSGDMNDPKFSYGQLVWKAFTNLITKLATAPFRALGALLGGESETLEAIMFEAGSADILPPEAEKLAHLASLLEKRPNLKLIVQGRYSQATDGQALKELQVRRQIALRQGVLLEAGEDPGLLDFGNPDVQLKLAGAFSERFGSQALTELRAPEASPGNESFGQAATGDSEDNVQDPAALWKKLYSALVAEELLAENGLMQLGEARAEAVMKVLHADSGLPEHRTMLKPARVLKPGKTPRAKMLLEPMKAKRVKKTAP